MTDLPTIAAIIRRHGGGVVASEQAAREIGDAVMKTVLATQVGSPSSRNDQNPDWWHLDRDCTPTDAAMHDNGVRRVYAALRELFPLHKRLGDRT